MSTLTNVMTPNCSASTSRELVPSEAATHDATLARGTRRRPFGLPGVGDFLNCKEGVLHPLLQAFIETVGVVVPPGVAPVSEVPEPAVAFVDAVALVAVVAVEPEVAFVGTVAFVAVVAAEPEVGVVVAVVEPAVADVVVVELEVAVAVVVEPGVGAVVVVIVEPAVAFVAVVVEPQVAVDIALVVDVLVLVAVVAVEVGSPGRPRFLAFPNVD